MPSTIPAWFASNLCGCILNQEYNVKAFIGIPASEHVTLPSWNTCGLNVVLMEKSATFLLPLKGLAPCYSTTEFDPQFASPAFLSFSYATICDNRNNVQPCFALLTACG